MMEPTDLFPDAFIYSAPRLSITDIYRFRQLRGLEHTLRLRLSMAAISTLEQDKLVLKAVRQEIHKRKQRNFLIDLAEFL
ncbi:conserved hypothetical protein [delta proteobacterium NaphS2]|nr:conserved hypothetical protein [delta proteobacterium NaphS2]